MSRALPLPGKAKEERAVESQAKKTKLRARAIHHFQK
jgi:hypothetical protein